jgi:hypothetical protein
MERLKVHKHAQAHKIFKPSFMVVFRVVSTEGGELRSIYRVCAWLEVTVRDTFSATWMTA